MRSIRAFLVVACLLVPLPFLLATSGHAQGIPQNIPRKELLILENPEGTVKNAGWFNIWAINAGSQSNGLQQVALDTLWYIDPESGLDGAWDNSLAADKPQYNADFTEMTVKVRKGIFWSDGVEFTADDSWRTTDLFLDVWKGRSGAPRLLDEDELNEAVRNGWIDSGLAATARAEAARLLEVAASPTWPPPPVLTWTLERCRSVLGAGPDV